MKKLALALLVAGTTSLFAADGAALYGKCKACHGANGKMTAMPKVEIAGQAVADIEKKLHGYKNGTYSNGKANQAGLMKGQVSRLSDEDITALATYINGL